MMANLDYTVSYFASETPATSNTIEGDLVVEWTMEAAILKIGGGADTLTETRTLSQMCRMCGTSDSIRAVSK